MGGAPLPLSYLPASSTVNWFTDQTWINFIFGNQLYGRGLLADPHLRFSDLRGVRRT